MPTFKTSAFFKLTLAIFTSVLLLSACGGTMTDAPKDKDELEREEMGSIFGDEMIFEFGKGSDDAGSGIAVNAFLWRASLDTISFLPIAQADAFGGVILTDWYSPANTPNERYKVNVYILGKALRADGLKVSVFKQKQVSAGNWVDIAVDPQTSIKLEDAILTKARQLRVGALNIKK